MRKTIEEQVAKYSPDDPNASEFKGTELLTFKQMLFRYANSCDKAYLMCGSFFSLCFGLVLPGFCLFFGNMIDDMGESTQ